MKRHRSLLAALGLLAAWAAAARAQEPRWTFRVLAVEPDIHRIDKDDRYFNYHITVQGKTGAGASLEVRPGRRVGVELTGLWLRLGQRAVTEYRPPLPPLRSEQSLTVSLRLVTLGFPIHLTPGQEFDLSITPLAGAALYGADLYSGKQNNPAYGLGLGLDWPFGDRRWALSGTVRVLEAEDEQTGFRPRWLLMRLFGLGISYRR